MLSHPPRVALAPRAPQTSRERIFTDRPERLVQYVVTCGRGEQQAMGEELDKGQQISRQVQAIPYEMIKPPDLIRTSN